MSRYDDLLAELSQIIGREVKPDTNDTCQLDLGDDITLFIEPEREGEDLILAFPLGGAAPGPGREALFKLALQTNGYAGKPMGRLAYSRVADQMVLFERANMDRLKGDQLAQMILAMIEPARLWRDAIKAGRIPPLPYPPEDL